MEIMRLVITGPVGAGKSSFIRTISEIEPVDTDKQATDEVGQLKKKTTVAMDFGRLQFGPELILHLYGIPGQERFDFMWEILVARAHAHILLVSSHRPQDFLAARRILAFVRRRIQVPTVIGLSHADSPDAWPPEDIAIALGFPHPQQRPPILPVNTLDKPSVINLMTVLVQTYLAQQARQKKELQGVLLSR